MFSTKSKDEQYICGTSDCIVLHLLLVCRTLLIFCVKGLGAILEYPATVWDIIVFKTGIPNQSLTRSFIFLIVHQTFLHLYIYILLLYIFHSFFVFYKLSTICKYIGKYSKVYALIIKLESNHKKVYLFVYFHSSETCIMCSPHRLI